MNSTASNRARGLAQVAPEGGVEAEAERQQLDRVDRRLVGPLFHLHLTGPALGHPEPDLGVAQPPEQRAARAERVPEVAPAQAVRPGHAAATQVEPVGLDPWDRAYEIEARSAHLECAEMARL